MTCRIKRGYNICCLRTLGIHWPEEHLAAVEKIGFFPRRVGPLMWDGDEIDEWVYGRDGKKPSTPICQ